MKKVFIALMSVCAAALIAFVYLKMSTAALISKTAASLLFTATGFLGYKQELSNRKFSFPMLIGFIFSTAGDVFLALNKGTSTFFVAGVISFAMAHVFFTAAFCRMCSLKPSDFAVFGGIFGVILCIFFFGEFNYNGMFPVIMAYAVIISFMVSKAFSLRRIKTGNERAVNMIAVGASLFILSDIVLLFVIFGISPPYISRGVNLTLYYSGQAFLSLSTNEKAFK